VLRARNRLAVAGGKGGSVAVFPPPHQFFFARSWRSTSATSGTARTRRITSRSASVRERTPRAITRSGPRRSSRSTTPHRDPAADAGLLLPQPRRSCHVWRVGPGVHPRRPLQTLPGYKTLVTHFHTAFTKELTDSGSLATTPPWIPMMRALGVNIAPHLRLPRRRPSERRRGPFG